MENKCGGREAPSREDMQGQSVRGTWPDCSSLWLELHGPNKIRDAQPLKPSAAAKPVTRRKAWDGPKRRVPKAPSREHAPAGQRNGEARDGLKGRGGPTKVATAVRLLTIKIIFGKDGGIMMAMFFAQRVILGKTTFANVPKALKAGVAEVLIDSGLPELVPTEYGGTADGE